MIMGSYPCCDGPPFLGAPERPGIFFAKEKCEHCGAAVWHKFSRLDPCSWKEEDFLKEFEVDHETMKITPKTEH